MTEVQKAASESPAQGPPQWLITLDANTFELIRMERVGAPAIGQRQFLLTHHSGEPLAVKLEALEGNLRRELTPEETARIQDAYVAAVTSAYTAASAETARYWQSYYAGYADHVAANPASALSADEIAYYTQAAVSR